MRIIRFISINDEIYWGIRESEKEKIARIIDGNIFGKFKVTSEVVEIKSILAPISPSGIIGVGLNYREHAEETGIKISNIPVMYIKALGSVVGPSDSIVLPRIAPLKVDFEAELAIVIGKKAKNVSSDHAMEYVLGYTCANDVTARDWQIRLQKSQWTRAKSFDTFCPLGPCLVTKDEIENPQKLALQSIINGKVYQDSNTSDMIFSIPQLISHFSQSMTLFPGTVILTGTPPGIGFTRIPPVYLKEGDNVSIIIEKIGRLSNSVILEE